MAKPDGPSTKPPFFGNPVAGKAALAGKRGRLQAALQTYSTLYPQDDEGRAVLKRLANDPDNRVSEAFAAILAPGDLGFWLIFAILGAAALKRGHAQIPTRHELVMGDHAKMLAALDTLTAWLAGFGDLRVPPLDILTTKRAREDAALILDARELLPRLRALAESLRQGGENLFSELSFSRKRQSNDAPTLAALRYLVNAIRAKRAGRPHGRAAAALVEAACEIDEIPDRLVRRAERRR